MAAFDMCFVVIILPLMLNATCLDTHLSATIRIVALIEMDLFLFFWLWVRDRTWSNLLRCEWVGQEEMYDFNCC